MSTKQTTPMWKCENCGQTSDKLNVHGYCAFCGSDAVAVEPPSTDLPVDETLTPRVPA